MRLKISENLAFFWDKGHLVCDIFLDHVQKSIKLEILPLMKWFSEWRDIESVKDLPLEMEKNELLIIIKQLIDHHIFIVEGSKEHQREEKMKLWNDWGVATKYYHMYTRTFKDEPFFKIEEDSKRLREKKEKYPQPAIFKTYKENQQIQLPPPIHHFDGEESFTKILFNRQTIRSFDTESTLSMDKLASVLYYGWGAYAITMDFDAGKAPLKTHPSGGARYPLEVYPCIFNVEGLDPGIYHYSVKDHSLEAMKKGNYRELVVKMCGDQPYTNLPQVVFFHTAVVERDTWKYDVARCYRVLLMDLGHASQTFYLVASWLKLGAFFTAALRDELIEDELELDWTQEIVLGVSGLGRLTSKVKKEKGAGRFIWPEEDSQ